MPDKKGKTYDRVFEQIKKLGVKIANEFDGLPDELVNGFNPISCLFVLELAKSNAIKKFWPQCQCLACFFHLGQCFLRKVFELLCNKEYETEEAFPKAIRMLYAVSSLALQPPSEVVPAFKVAKLSQEAMSKPYYSTSY